MKTVKKLFFVLVAIAVSLAISDASLAAFGSQGGAGGEGGIVVVKEAPGTKYEGPLTIYYDKEGINTGFANLYFFLRLKKGMDLYGFSGFADSTNLDYCNNPEFELDDDGNKIPVLDDNREPVILPGINLDVECIQNAMTSFVTSTVIPFLYPDGPAPTFALKSVGAIVEDQANNCCHFFFTIMDVTIAVQD